jgi:hypothetical protein
MRLENKFGFVEYRMPTVKEGLTLLHGVGINANTANKEWMIDNFLMIVANMIDHVDKFVEKVEMIDGEKKIDNFKELASSARYLQIVQAICTSIFSEINSGDAEK